MDKIWQATCDGELDRRRWGGPRATARRTSGTPMQDDGPTYGLGADGRPLWTMRDRDAERIRALLRRARRTGSDSARGGFVVTGGHDGDFLVTFTAANETCACTSALTSAGLSVEPQPGKDRTFRVRFAEIR